MTADVCRACLCSEIFSNFNTATLFDRNWSLEDVAVCDNWVAVLHDGGQLYGRGFLWSVSQLVAVG